MRITDNDRDAGECGEFFRSALSVATGDDNTSGGVSRVNFADGVACLGVRGGGNRAGIEDHDIGRGRIGGHDRALLAELALDGGTIGLRGAATELLDVECAHERSFPRFYLITPR